MPGPEALFQFLAQAFITAAALLGKMDVASVVIYISQKSVELK